MSLGVHSTHAPNRPLPLGRPTADNSDQATPQHGPAPDPPKQPEDHDDLEQEDDAHGDHDDLEQEEDAHADPRATPPQTSICEKLKAVIVNPK